MRIKLWTARANAVVFLPLACGVVLLTLSSALQAQTEAGAETEFQTQAQAQSEEPEKTGLQGRPKWEFGVGGGYFDGFDYPGSIDSNRRALALPFFIYRSERFRFGGGGLSAVAIEEPRLKLDWSVAASLNATNDPGGARAGMPDIDFLIEIGPRLIFRALDVESGSGRSYRIDWSTKLRGVVSTDFGSVTDRGFVFESSLTGRIGNVTGNNRITLVGALSARAASERLNDYFYEVRQEFVTPEREAFDARAGLIDIRATAGVGFRLPYRVRLFVAATTGFYDNAANRDSPVHQAKRSTSMAVGVVWTIFQSKTRVGVLEVDSN